MTLPARIVVARAMREDRGRFAGVRDSRVLVYWPHGLGDWVHLGAIAPLLEASNRYAIVRFGDDYAAVMEGNPHLMPLPSGVRPPGTGAEAGTPHLGLELRKLRGGPAALALAPPLDSEIAAFAPDVLLWTDYPETEGRTAYPFHTKARNLARLIVHRDRLASFDLSQPLINTVDFTASPSTQRALDERLAAFAPPGTRLGVLSRAGITAARKNWGDGSEARTFVETMRRYDAAWRFVSMDDEDLGDGVAGFRQLFATIGDPFARIFKALMARTALFIGVPAGPLHLTLARGGVPTVGVWLAHHPDWYDEPNPDAIHLVGAFVRERGFDRRVASTSKPASLRHRLVYLDSHGASASHAVDAARSVL